MLHQESVQSRIKKNGSQFGNKAANLIELDTLCKTFKSNFIQIQIPHIIPISDTTIKKHLDNHAPLWKEKFQDFIKEQKDNKKLTPKSKEIIQQLQKIITTCFHEHPFSSSDIDSMNLPKDSLFMLRSTGEEDTTEMANPGGNKSVAAVKWDREAISNAIGTVVASYVSQKSLKQRLLSNDDITKPPFMPVLLQTMIGEKINGEKNLQNIVVSGVMYAKGALTRIEAAYGHGELIVNSKAPFDIYDVTQNRVVHAEIHKKIGRLIPIQINNEKRKLAFIDNPKALQDSPSFTPDIAKEIALVGEKIQLHYGMPMDIEFVYQPKEKLLSIVQARPIPEAQQKMQPSAISPELWLQLKKDSTIEKIKAKVITPAGRIATVITNMDGVIITNTLGDALKKYLADDKNQENIRAIVVKEEAPSTSHEAAIFNALSIPVMQGDTETLETWLKEKNPGIIVDTQHQHLVNIKKHLKDQTNIEKEIIDKKIIIEGLFSSILANKKTLLMFTKESEEPIANTIKTYLEKSADTIPTKFIYHKLLDDIQILETSKPNKTNQKGFEALKNIADIFRRLSTSTAAQDKNNPHKKLFVHAMHAIADIHLCLASYGKIGDNSDCQIKKLQELLDLISKLKALVVNSGEQGLFSDSILQIAMQHKAESYLDTKENIFAKQNQDICIELLKLGALALNENTKLLWKKLVIDASKKNHTQQMLAKIVLFCTQNSIQSELINNYFIQSYEKYKTDNSQTINKKVLQDLYLEIDKTEMLFNKLNISDNRRIITSFEKRIPEWSNPKKYAKLHEDFEREFIPLIDKLNKSYIDDIPNIAKASILRQVQLLTEVLDKTIKSLKGSPDYKSEPTGVLIERFYSLLIPYHQLMQDWMMKIPEKFYDDCAKNIMDASHYNKKNRMIDEIKATFKDKITKIDIDQLQPSGKFSVASARIGSVASFYRQMVYYHDKLTLEDLFTLFHQNILSSTHILGKNVGIHTTVEHLPQNVIPLIQNILKTKNIDLLHVSQEPSTLTFIFNLPIANHSAEIDVTYNLKTGEVSIHWKFIGGNWGERMELIALTSMIDCMVVEGLLTKMPKPDKNYYGNMEFQWNFKSNELNLLQNTISEIIQAYGRYTECSTEKAMRDLLKRNEKINIAKLLEKMPPDIKKEIHALTNQICDVSMALDMSPEVLYLFGDKFDLVKELKSLFLKYVRKSELNDLKKLLNMIPENQFNDIFYQQNTNGDNALVIAAINKDFAMVNFLLEKDKDNVLINMKDKTGQSFKHIQIDFEFLQALDEKNYAKLIKILQTNNIQLSSINTIYKNSYQNILGDHYILLSKSNNFEIFKNFVNALPEEIFQKIFLHTDSVTDTALLHAAYNKSYDMLDWLIAQDKDGRLRALRNKFSHDYFYYIYENMHDHVDKYQFGDLKKAFRYLGTNDEYLEKIKTFFLYYARKGNLEVLKAMAETFPEAIFEAILLHCDENGNSALLLATAKSQQTVVDWLLQMDTKNKLKPLVNKNGENYEITHELMNLAENKKYKELDKKISQYTIQYSIDLLSKELISPFKSILYDQVLDLVKEKKLGELKEFTTYFSKELLNTLFIQKTDAILTTAAHHLHTEIVDFILENFPELSKAKSYNGYDYLDNFSLGLKKLAYEKKYDEMKKILDKYKNIPLDKLFNDVSVISIIEKQLFEYVSTGKNEEFYIFEKLFPIADFPMFYKYKDDMKNSLLIWSAYNGNEDLFDKLLAMDKDKKLRYEKSDYGFDAIENLSLYLLLVARASRYDIIKHYLNKYEEISFDVDDKRTPNATLKSALREQLVKHVKENDLKNLDALYNAIPQRIFDDLLTYKENADEITLVKKLENETSSSIVKNWLVDHSTTNYPMTGGFLNAKKRIDESEILISKVSPTA